ncbi:MAG: hypothetical protein ACI9E1_000590, partial [Cryomorphaceae bacterium]
MRRCLSLFWYKFPFQGRWAQYQCVFQRRSLYQRRERSSATHPYDDCKQLAFPESELYPVNTSLYHQASPILHRGAFYFLCLVSFKGLVICMFYPKILLTCFLATTTLLSAQVAPTKIPPGDHVLMITIDDLNDWIGCLSDPEDPKKANGHVTGRGHPQAKTPNLDRLAKRGILFANAHCQAPICRPSRASFMSGLRPTTTGLYGNRPQYDGKGKLQPGNQVPWMTQRFEQAGYEVFTAGKLLHASRNKPLGGI